MFFDFGGVLTTSPFDAFASYEQRSGLPSGFLRSLNATNPNTNAWARLERNELDLHEFVSAFEDEALAAGYEVDGLSVLECLDGAIRPRMVEAVRACRQRFITALLTNNFISEDAPNNSLEEISGLFDHIVESSRVGVRKPDEAFYLLACELAEVAPEEVVFLDDLGINLKPARALGMTTIKVEDPDEALRMLAEFVGPDVLS